MYICQVCTPAQRCPYHKAWDEIEAKLDEEAMMLELYEFKRGGVIDVMMSNYNSEKYWRLQAMHRAGEP